MLTVLQGLGNVQLRKKRKQNKTFDIDESKYIAHTAYTCTTCFNFVSIVGAPGLKLKHVKYFLGNKVHFGNFYQAGIFKTRSSFYILHTIFAKATSSLLN